MELNQRHWQEKNTTETSEHILYLLSSVCINYDIDLPITRNGKKAQCNIVTESTEEGKPENNPVCRVKLNLRQFYSVWRYDICQL